MARKATPPKGASNRKLKGKRGGRNGQHTAERETDARAVAGLVILCVGLLALVSQFIPSSGGLINLVSVLVRGMGGALCLLLPMVLCGVGVALALFSSGQVPVRAVVCGALTFLLAETFFHLAEMNKVVAAIYADSQVPTYGVFLMRSFQHAALTCRGGGLIGALLSWPLATALDVWGATIVLVFISALVLVLFTGVSFDGVRIQMSEWADDMRVVLDEQGEEWAIKRENREKEALQREEERAEAREQRRIMQEERELARKQARAEAEEARRREEEAEAAEEAARQEAEARAAEERRQRKQEAQRQEAQRAEAQKQEAQRRAEVHSRVTIENWTDNVVSMTAHREATENRETPFADQSPQKPREPQKPQEPQPPQKPQTPYLVPPIPRTLYIEKMENLMPRTAVREPEQPQPQYHPDGRPIRRRRSFTQDEVERAFRDNVTVLNQKTKVAPIVTLPVSRVQTQPVETVSEPVVQEPIAQESRAQDIPVEEMPYKEPAYEEPVSVEPLQDTFAYEGYPQEEPPHEESSYEEMPYDETLYGEVSSEEPPYELMEYEEPPREETSDEETLYIDFPYEDVLDADALHEDIFVTDATDAPDEIDVFEDGTEDAIEDVIGDEIEIEAVADEMDDGVYEDGSTPLSRAIAAAEAEANAKVSHGQDVLAAQAAAVQNQTIVQLRGNRMDGTPIVLPMKDPHEPPKVEGPAYIYPPMDLLDFSNHSIDPNLNAKIEAGSQKLLSTLEDFGVQATLSHVTHGPAITRYELQPGKGVKVSRIVNLVDDIALNMAAQSVRIEAPIPGKSAVGIEIPNDKIEMVSLRDVLESDAMMREKSPTAVALGKGISGESVVADIAKMPHVLIAGATGSGKSVCINTIINSIIYRADPKEVRLILIDPKVVELSVYNGIPHLLVPVVTDPKKASAALSWAVIEMEHRYKRFETMGVRNIKGYNEAIGPDEEPMSKIIVIIDELADLMLVAPGEVEESICRLAQLARAAGIHLIIATQRPSVNVITGVIKANIPSRIAFAVSSQIDSRTILDAGGAEKLLGRGDMLYAPYGSGKPTRVQGCFVSDDEVQRIVDFVRGKHTAEYNEDVMEQMNASAEEEKAAPNDLPSGNEQRDEMLDKAIELAVEAGQVSISMLQRRLRVGYARAGRLVDEMTCMGITAEAEGPTKPRTVLISREEWRRMQENKE